MRVTRYDVYKRPGAEITEVWSWNDRIAAVKAVIKWQGMGEIYKGIVYVRDAYGNISLHGVG